MYRPGTRQGAGAVPDKIAMVEVYIGLGSNLDEPVNQLKTAIENIGSIPDTRLKAVSTFYRSKPVGPQDQPDFINAVARLDTELSALSLLQKLQDIEDRQHRQRSARWGPRTIDLDILLYGDQVINEKQLTVPHMHMHNRGFVLYPLSEIAPGLEIPGLGSVESLVSKTGTGDLQQVDPDG